MKKTFLTIFLSLSLLLPGAAIIAQEPTAEVTVEPTPPPPEDIPGDEDDSVFDDKDITSLFGVPPEIAAAMFAFVLFATALLKQLLPEKIGPVTITSRGITIVISTGIWGAWWLFGRFGYDDEFLKTLDMIRNVGPFLISWIGILGVPSFLYATVFRDRVPFLGARR